MTIAAPPASAAPSVNMVSDPRTIPPDAALNLAEGFLPRGFTANRAAEGVRRANFADFRLRPQRKRAAAGPPFVERGEARYWLFCRLRKRGMSIGSRL